MKFTKLLVSMLLSLFVFTGCALNDKGIIKINGKTITQSEFDKKFQEITSSPQYAMLGQKVANDDSFIGLIIRDRIVNEMLVNTLLKEETDKRNIKVEDSEIQAKLDEIKAKVGGEEAFQNALKTNNISEKRLKEDLEHEIKVDKLVSSVSKIEVTDKDAKDFYDKNKKQFDMPERVRASHILVAANKDEIRQAIINADKNGELNAKQIDERVNQRLNEIKQKAINLQKQATAENFAKLATENSEDPGSSKNGGDLNFFKRGEMVKPFEDVAFKLPVNKVSEVVETPFGYHIILVTDRAKAGVLPFDKAKDDIIQSLTQQKKVDALQKLFEGLKAEANIEYLDDNYNPETIQNKLKNVVQAQQDAAKKAEEAQKADKTAKEK